MRAARVGRAAPAPPGGTQRDTGQEGRALRGPAAVPALPPHGDKSAEAASSLSFQDVLGILILCLVPAAAALDFKYHHSEEVEGFLREVRAAHPALTHLYSIGRSVEGKGGGQGREGFLFLLNRGGCG